MLIDYKIGDEIMSKKKNRKPTHQDYQTFLEVLRQSLRSVHANDDGIYLLQNDELNALHRAIKVIEAQKIKLINQELEIKKSV